MPPSAVSTSGSYIVAYGVLILLALFFIFPIAFMIAGSFKADTSVIADSGSLKAFVPEPFVGLENFQQAAERGNFWTSFRNSAIISAGIVFGGLLDQQPLRLRACARALPWQGAPSPDRGGPHHRALRDAGSAAAPDHG